jgi:hypothetical protein
VGISYQTGEYKIYLFPIQSNNSQLSLMTGENKNNFFKKIADWSNITQNFEKQLLSGQVLIK